MNLSILSLSLVLAAAQPANHKVIDVYPGPAPGSKGKEAEDRPTLTIYLPPAEKATGAAVVICPGGGYGFLANDHEGKQPAEWLNKLGVAAFILKYRVVSKDRPEPLLDAPLYDAQRAIRTVRAHAKDYGIDPQRIGIWGFSAGGHLASTAETHFDDGKPDAGDPIERASCRPDFAILCYPVVSMKEGTTHGGSRKNLLGSKPDEKLVEYYSNERQVTAKTPPTFIFQTDEDNAVPAENCVQFYLACRKAHVPVEMHIFEKGVHGVGLAPKDPVLSTWPDLLATWMKQRGLLKASAK
ncbi:MAG: alpha/beta hydrolase [Gemmataceae bacterium]